MDEPAWERGKTTHAYRIGTRRVGCVSLPPKGFPAEQFGYSAWIDHPFTLLPRARTLADAKRLVEAAVGARKGRRR